MMSADPFAVAVLALMASAYGIFTIEGKQRYVALFGFGLSAAFPS
jgi:hypothetical protein